MRSKTITASYDYTQEPQSAPGRDFPYAYVARDYQYFTCTTAKTARALLYVVCHGYGVH